MPKFLILMWFVGYPDVSENTVQALKYTSADALTL